MHVLYSSVRQKYGLDEEKDLPENCANNASALSKWLIFIYTALHLLENERSKVCYSLGLQQSVTLLYNMLKNTFDEWSELQEANSRTIKK